MRSLICCDRNEYFTAATVSLCSPDHIGLLVHKTFNATIPRSAIPNNKWKFEHEPAAESLNNTADSPPNEIEQAPEIIQSHGSWMHNESRVEQSNIEFLITRQAFFSKNSNFYLT